MGLEIFVGVLQGVAECRKLEAEDGSLFLEEEVEEGRNDTALYFCLTR